MEQAIRKADTLIEAMPYIQSFRGKIVVIKLGGSAMKDDAVMQGVVQDIVFLKTVGIEPVLIHGGGPHINSELAKINKKSTFIKGYRYTDEEILDVVVKVTTGISRSIVETMSKFGNEAVCVWDLDNNPIKAEKFLLDRDAGFSTDESEDLGFVGKISDVDTKTLRTLCDSGKIPIIPPVAKGDNNQTFNVNADSVASYVAQSLSPEKLVVLSDTHGIMRDPGDENSFASTLHEDEIRELIQKGVITSGMLPKVNACVSALTKGVKKAHIIDGRIPHSLLLEIFTVKGIGTQIIV